MVLHSVGDWIKKKLQKYVPEEERMQSALSYGVDMALYTLFSTIGLLLIAAVLNSFITGMILIAVFYLNQTIGGGYHANSYLKCFLCMSVILLSGIAFGKLSLPNFILYILGLASGMALWMISGRRLSTPPKCSWRFSTLRSTRSVRSFSFRSRVLS